MEKVSRFTVKKRSNINRPPKFGLTAMMLKGRRRVLKHHHRSQSPRKATLKRYNASRPMGDYDIINTPRQKGRFRVTDVEPVNQGLISSKKSRR